MKKNKTLGSKSIYLSIYLYISKTKKVKDLYTENYNILVKDIKEAKRKISHAHELEKMLLKCPYYSKPSKDSMQSLSKFQHHFS